MMDVANSTELSTKKTPLEIALMFHEIIKISNDIIFYDFYPFIQFVEAVGDSLLFWHCPDLSHPLDDIHCECINFAIKLTNRLNCFLKVYGTYSYRYMLWRMWRRCMGWKDIQIIRKKC